MHRHFEAEDLALIDGLHTDQLVLLYTHKCRSPSLPPPLLPSPPTSRTTHSAGTPLPPHPLPPSAPTVGPYTFRSPCVLCLPGTQPQGSGCCLKDLYSQDRLKVPGWVDHCLHQPVTDLPSVNCVWLIPQMSEPYLSVREWPQIKVTQCTGHNLANTWPHQLH